MTVEHGTIKLEKCISAPRQCVFEAYLNSDKRELWAAPNENVVLQIESADVRTGGFETTRCGSKDDLQFTTKVHYHQVVENELICFSESTFHGDDILMVALITITFRNHDQTETIIELTDLVASFIGASGIKGHKEGFAGALSNWKSYAEQNC